MVRITLGDIQALIKIRIFKDESGKYSVEGEGFRVDRTRVKGVIDTWSSLNDALICARGVSKMFHLKFAYVVIDLGDEFKKVVKW
jgi:hypothetical protein